MKFHPEMQDDPQKLGYECPLRVLRVENIIILKYF